jgi:hypothetical protein
MPKTRSQLPSDSSDEEEAYLQTQQPLSSPPHNRGGAKPDPKPSTPPGTDVVVTLSSSEHHDTAAPVMQVPTGGIGELCTDEALVNIADLIEHYAELMFLQTNMRKSHYHTLAVSQSVDLLFSLSRFASQSNRFSHSLTRESRFLPAHSFGRISSLLTSTALVDCTLAGKCPKFSYW